MKRAVVLASVMVAAVAALSGCVRATQELAISADGTVSGEMIFAAAPGVLDSLAEPGVEETGVDLLGVEFAQRIADQFTDATVTPWESNGMEGSRITFTDEPFESFAKAGVTIERAGDRITVNGSTQAVLSAAGVPVTMEDLQGQLGGLPPGAGSVVDVYVKVTFPGNVIEHDGVLEGRTVTWNLLGGQDEFSASSGVGGLFIPPWVWVALGLAAVVGGAAWVLAQDRRVRAARTKAALERSVQHRHSAPGLDTEEDRGTIPT